MVKRIKLVPEHFVSRRNTLRQVLFTTLFAYLFINVYKPFGAREWYDVSWWLFFAASGLLVLAGMLVVILSRLVMFAVKQRRPVTFLYYVVMVAGEVFFMGVLYAVLERMVLGDIRPFGVLFYLAIQNTSLILLIPYSMSLLYFAWREKKVTLEMLLRQIRSKPQFISFKDENNVLRYTIKAVDLIYLEASDNYVVIHFQAGEKNKSLLLRNTLKNLETSLEGFPLLRCHRSFMVNIDRVKILKRERGRFTLCMDDLGAIKIPVSKSYSDSVSEKFDVSQI